MQGGSPWGAPNGQVPTPSREVRFYGKSQSLTKAERRARAEAIKAEAQKSLPDKYGNVRCLSCGKVLSSYEGLAGHLVSLHDGENSEERKLFEGTQSAGKGVKGRPPVLLSEGLAPLLESWPTDWRAQEGRASEAQRKIAKAERERQRTTVNILANHAADTVSGEGHRREAKSDLKRGDKKVQNPNTAQSTEFVERRGKEREQPKKKRVSKLKKTVLQERETRAGASVTAEVCERLQDGADFEQAVSGSMEELSRSDDASDSVMICGASHDTCCRGVTDAVQHAKEGDIEILQGSVQSERHDESGVLEVARKQRGHEPMTYLGPHVKIRYCRQVISTELNTTCFELLKELVRFQERVRAQEPSKLKMKRRLVTGFREVAKSVRTKRAKCIIVAPNIEETVEEGALDTSLSVILEGAQQNGIEAVFALTRLRIAQVFGRRVRMSIVAVLSFEGADELYKKTLQLAAVGRTEWELVHNPS